MRLLLDTHALLWWWGDDAQLSSAARQTIADEDNVIMVSAASAWEIATKQRLGKVPPFPVDGGRFHQLLEADGFQSLPVTPAHACAPALRRPCTEIPSTGCWQRKAIWSN